MITKSIPPKLIWGMQIVLKNIPCKIMSQTSFFERPKVTMCNYCNSITHQLKNCPRWISDKRYSDLRKAVKWNEFKLMFKMWTVT